MISVEIVPYSPVYLDQIIAEQRELYLLNFKDISFLDLNDLREWYEDGATRTAVMIEGDKVVGFYLYQKLFDRTTAYLMQIHIVAKHRKKGLGAQLIRHFEDSAIREKCCTASLEVSLMNPQAVNFYDKAGYKRTAIKYQAGEPRQYMVKILL